MSKVILLRNSKTPDANFRPDFVSVLEKNACDDKCNRKIKEIKENKGLYLSKCLVFHIGTKRNNLDLDNIVKFYINGD